MSDRIASACRAEADFIDDNGCCQHCGVEMESRAALAAMLRRAANHIDELCRARAKLLDRKLPKPKAIGSNHD